MNENELATKIIGLSIKVHSELGPGLLENAYKHSLAYELIQASLVSEVEKPMPLIYKGAQMDCGYRIDILVENKIPLEIKSIDAFNEIHMAQVLTYLKLSNCKLGLLLNFNVVRMRDGIKCVIRGYL